MWLEGSKLKEDYYSEVWEALEVVIRTPSLTLSKLHTLSCFKNPRNSVKKLIHTRCQPPWETAPPTHQHCFCMLLQSISFNHVSVMQHCGPLMYKYVLEFY